MPECSCDPSDPSRGWRECSTRLEYSYPTCGNIDSFTSGREMEMKLESIAAARPLRVGIPGDEDIHLITLADGAPGVGGTGRDGSTLLFADDVFRRHNIRWQQVPITEDSRHFSPLSSYTACVHDIALNRTDLCIGPFWTTGLRRRLASFSSTLFLAQMKLLVPIHLDTDNPSVWEMINVVFRPFDGEVWGWLAATLMYVGLIRWLIEPAEARGLETKTGSAAKEVNSKDINAQSPVRSVSVRSGRAGVPTLKRSSFLGNGIKDEVVNTFGTNQISTGEVVLTALHDAMDETQGRTRRKRRWGEISSPTSPWKRIWKALSNLSYHEGMMLQGSMGDWRGEDPRNLSEWILLVGVTFSMLVIVTFYTAQVTQNLIFQKEATPSVRSMQEVIDRRMKICSLEAFYAQFSAIYTDVVSFGLMRNTSDFTEVVAGLDDGTCDVGIISEDHWTFIAGESPEICSAKGVLTSTLIHAHVAFPIADALAKPLAFAFDKAVKEGAFTLALANAEARFLPQTRCQVPGGGRRRLSAEGRQPSAPTKAAKRQLKASASRPSGAVASSTISSTAESVESTQQLTVHGAAGPLIIAALAATTALVVHVLERLLALSGHRTRRNSINTHMREAEAETESEIKRENHGSHSPQPAESAAARAVVERDGSRHRSATFRLQLRKTISRNHLPATSEA